MAGVTPRMSEQILLPSEGESAAIPMDKFRTAALCYDRIWSPADELVPRSIRCFGGSPAELSWVRLFNDPNILGDKLVSVLKRAKSIDEIVAGIVEGFDPVARHVVLGLVQVCLELAVTSMDVKEMKSFLSLNQKNLRDRMVGGLRNHDSIVKKVQQKSGGILHPVCREIAKSFSGEHRMPMVPIYESEEKRDSEYHEGNGEAVVMALGNLQIVDEDKVTWGQVIEFRKEEESRRKYRRFLHWLDKGMVGKSQAFLEDEISERLEDYEWALKKHGIKTVLGTIDEALDGKYLIGAGGLALAGHPILGLLGAGLLIGSKVGVKLKQTKLDFDDVERGLNSEISWVYEVKDLGK